MQGYTRKADEHNEEAIAFRKAADYCAAQEHSVSEVRLKLHAWGIDGNLAGKIIDQLLEEGFIDELRYAKAFARGKFRNLEWGKIKIRAELKYKKISAEHISSALDEIDPEEYSGCLKELLDKKLHSLGVISRENKFKAMRFALSKGFEPELINALLRDD